jgi:hypothetical protein
MSDSGIPNGIRVLAVAALFVVGVAILVGAEIALVVFG